MSNRATGCGMKLSISQEGYVGREREVRKLREAYQQVTCPRSSISSTNVHTKYVVVSGGPGCGKRSLVESYPWPENCFFITGRFSKEAEESTPFAAFRQAFGQLCTQWGESTVNSKLGSPMDLTTSCSSAINRNGMRGTPNNGRASSSMLSSQRESTRQKGNPLHVEPSFRFSNTGFEASKGLMGGKECEIFCQTQMKGYYDTVARFLPELIEVGNMSPDTSQKGTELDTSIRIGGGSHHSGGGNHHSSSRIPASSGHSLRITSSSSHGDSSSRIPASSGHSLKNAVSSTHGQGPLNAIYEDSTQTFFDSTRSMAESTTSFETSTGSISLNGSSSRIGSLHSAGSARSLSTQKQLGAGRNALQRFRKVLLKILLHLASPSRPVVFFMNDLQWADQKSLDLIRGLVEEPQLNGLLVVGTYSKEENCNVDYLNEHLRIIAKSSKRNRSPLVQIKMKDFALVELNILLAKITQRTPDDTLSLAKVIYQKTNGNPFFVDQCLGLLQREGYLEYSFMSCKWEWKDAEVIEQAMSIVSTKVADIIASSIKSMDPDTQEVLKVASCIGSHIPIHIMNEYFRSFVDSVTVEDESKACLDYNAHAGDQKILCGIMEDLVCNQVLKKNAGSSVYVWSHENIQMAVYSLMDHEKINRVRLRLGSVLLRMSCWEFSAKNEALLFMATNQFNQVPTTILESVVAEEGRRLHLFDIASLNLFAAKLSISKAAYFPALNLLKTGIRVLKPGKHFSLMKSFDRKIDPWADHYELFLDLHNNLFETEFVLGHYEDAKSTINTVLDNGKSVDDKFRAQACLLEIISSDSARDYISAMRECLVILNGLGIKIITNPTPINVRVESNRLRFSLPRKKIENVVTLPLTNDQRARGVSLLFGMVANYANLSGHHRLAYFVSIKALQFIVEHGIGPNVCVIITNYGLALRMLGDIAKAEEMSQLAERLLKRFGNKNCDYYVKTTVTSHMGLLAVKKPLHDSLDTYLDCYHSGVQTGDVEYALLSSMCYCMHYLFVGLTLSPFLVDCQTWRNDCRSFGLPKTISCMFAIFEQTIECLQGNSEDPCLLKGNAMDQDEVLDSLMNRGRCMTLRDICTYRLMLSYIFRDFATAKKMLEALSSFPEENPVVARMHTRIAFSGLMGFKLHRKNKKKKYGKIADKALKYFKQEAKNGSLNAYPIFCFLDAERSQRKEDYERAIKVCSRSGLMSFEAMANESAAEMFKARNDHEWAKTYLQRAIDLYDDWGCSRKVEQLRTTHGLVDMKMSGRLESTGRKGIRKLSSQKAFSNYDRVSFEESELSPIVSPSLY